MCGVKSSTRTCYNRNSPKIIPIDQDVPVDQGFNVTITDANREMFQSTVVDFRPQIQEDMCLPTALKNVLDELADRHDGRVPLSQLELNDICDYREGSAATARNVPARLNPEIEDYGIEVKVAIGLTFDDLGAIITDNERSLPIVELKGGRGKYSGRLDRLADDLQLVPFKRAERMDQRRETACPRARTNPWENETTETAP